MKFGNQAIRFSVKVLAFLGIYKYISHILSSENSKLTFTFFIIAIPLILYYIFLGPYYAKNYPGILIIIIILHIISSLLMIIVVFTDPGIIPKIVRKVNIILKTDKYEMSEEITMIPYNPLTKKDEAKTLQCKSHCFKLKFC